MVKIYKNLEELNKKVKEIEEIMQVFKDFNEKAKEINEKVKIYDEMFKKYKEFERNVKPISPNETFNEDYEIKVNCNSLGIGEDHTPYSTVWTAPEEVEEGDVYAPVEEGVPIIPRVLSSKDLVLEKQEEFVVDSNKLDGIVANLATKSKFSSKNKNNSKTKKSNK